MSLKNRNPSIPRKSDTPIDRNITKFRGMLTGEPASEIPKDYSALNYNVIDFVDYHIVRSGSRPYTALKIGYQILSVDINNNIIILDGVHPWETGDVVYLNGDDLVSPLAESTAYYVIDSAANKIQVALTYALALAGTAIALNSLGVGTQWVYYGEINGYCDHDLSDKLIFMFGKTVYTCTKTMLSLTKVLNYGDDPEGVSTIIKDDDEARLLSGTGIYRIIFGDEFDSMYPINAPVPDTLIDDANETESNIYGYLYIYAIAILDGTGNRSRIDDTVLFESGTCLKDGQAKDYGERYFSTEIGIDITETHEVATMTVPDGVKGITHMPLFRSRQIGENSGGVTSSIDGVGNSRKLIIWCADVPVAKAFIIDVAANVATIVSGNTFVRGDVTSALKDTAGTEVDISTYTDENTATLTAGLNGNSIYCAIGGGRVMKASQSGNTVTISEGDSVVVGDTGELVIVSDGTYRHVVKYLTGGTFEVAETGDFTDLAITMRTTSGNFSRTWNDTVPDDPNDSVVGSLEDLYLYGGDNYVPRRFFRPLPNSNVGVIDSGFLVVANRDEGRYYYCQIGDKPYNAGYYHQRQTRKVAGTIRLLVLFPFKAVFLMRGQTGVLILTNSKNVGDTTIGENVFELSEMSVVDTKRGVNLWQTVEFKNENLIYALTDDFAYRHFDGNAWSKRDFAFEDGRDAVSKEYLRKIDQSTVLVAFYTPYGAMRIWMGRRTTAVSTTEYDTVMFGDDVDEEENWNVVDLEAAGGDEDAEYVQFF